MLQRQSSPRVQVQLKKSSGLESNHPHQRPIIDRSSNVGDRRSPRGSQSADSTQHKKLGTRVADLESQLGQAQEELKSLKNQLASAEAAKKEVQEELEKKNTYNPLVPDTDEEQNHPPTPTDIQETNSIENSLSTDVFEVPLEPTPYELIALVPERVISEQFDVVTKPIGKCNEPLLLEPRKHWDDINNQVAILTAKLEEKDREIELLHVEHERLNKQVIETAAEFTSSRTKEMETALCLSQMEAKFEESKANTVRLKQELEAMDTAKTALEAEMKAMMVQTDQWRKAADAAAAVLAGGFDMNGRCISMDKHANNGGGGAAAFDVAGIYTCSFEGSPMMADDMEYGVGSTKRKGSGIRMFGDLWKKKGQK
ncbi:hypothetical protein GIB67_031666 [Kingdonia uniflora]|uniref:Uncharacterized protein n=1 Tax=Kingdonia uniflora TaxID=39325 RepID=A0A7J7NJU1_9MAGN|nr:hypothetical protein GIB67_031666 [Kingdonia uniflora]